MRVSKIDSLEKAYLVARLAQDKKAEDLKILDMRGLSNFCDFFVILTASSGRRAEAVAENIQDGFREKGLAVRAKEGSEDTKWILIDLFDVVAHIFDADTRQFYNLDRLWADAPEIKLPVKKKKCLKKNSKACWLAS